jgi:hypothetical protein
MTIAHTLAAAIAAIHDRFFGRARRAFDKLVPDDAPPARPREVPPDWFRFPPF